MDKSFHIENRQDLYKNFEVGTILLLFAGNPIRMSADAFYSFYTNRNFLYLTGLSGSNTKGFIFMAQLKKTGPEEKIYILPPDMLAERWDGIRLKEDEVKELSGIENISFIENFEKDFHAAMNSGAYHTVGLDLFKLKPGESDDVAHSFIKYIDYNYPFMKTLNLYPQIRRQRTIKKPCEVEAMRKAIEITGQAIEAMMKAAKPGIYEYELRACFDDVLARDRVFMPGFPPIISVGENNFSIHYDGRMGRAEDGDMVLNDVGARYDEVGCDVSRGWPVNGKFSEKQALLYQAAYNTSEHMFKIIKPGMPMKDVDRLAKEYVYEELKEIGLCQSWEDVNKYIWHGGAHHVGYDTHDVVEAQGEIRPGMIFCVDVGIYCQEWGIGFRLEDNCLVTEDGCENLSRDIPRTIEEIERVMAK